jgi:hypothetical protein
LLVFYFSVDGLISGFIDCSSLQAERTSGVVLVQRVLRPQSRIEDEETTASDLRRIVKELNNKFAKAALKHRPSSFSVSLSPSPALSMRLTGSNNNNRSIACSTLNMGNDDENTGGWMESSSSKSSDPTSSFRYQASAAASVLAVQSSEQDLVSIDDARAIALSCAGVFIDFQEVDAFHPLSDSDRFALYLSADLLLLTPIREGLNLCPLEYIYARTNQARAGAVIVSEFSTCSSLLNGSLKVNPFSPLAVCDAIEKALSMSSRECEYRRQRDLPFILSHPSSLWTKQIVNELEQLSCQLGLARNTPAKLAEPLNCDTLHRTYMRTAE